MFNKLKNIDVFTKNIIIVFAGTSLVNFLNLLYQLLIAHKLSASEFAAFNSLLSIYMVITAPLVTIHMAVAKYSAEFNAHNQVAKIKLLLSELLKKIAILAGFILLFFSLASNYIVKALKIPSVSCGYILAVLLALSWLSPVFSGGVQGLELFGWMTGGAVVTGALKLVLAFILILLGYNIAGALGALLASSLIGLIIFYFPLRRFISIRTIKEDINPVRDTTNPTNQIIVSNRVNYKEIINYLSPVAISYFCFANLISIDMILVKYFFTSQDSGLYALGQMVGKIFLFLPGAISIVMFPRTCGLNAKKIGTGLTLKKSLLYAAVLCTVAFLGYNLFPEFTLKVLTGKAFPESILLGRLFSVSMSFFAVLFILISYFLSIKEFCFIKYLVLFTLLQFFAVILLHRSLIQVQLILCINAILLFFIHLILAKRKELSLNRQE